MTIEPLEQAIATTRGVVAGVGPEQLDETTPCESWKVRDLLGHVIGGHRFFAAALRGEAPSGGDEPLPEDFLAAYDEATAACASGFAADGALDQTYELPFGTMPGSAFMGLATTDTFVHGWDLAKATGQSTDLDPTLASALLEQAKMAIQDSFRGPEGAPFGPEAEAPSDATPADRLAAFLGRSV